MFVDYEIEDSDSREDLGFKAAVQITAAIMQGSDKSATYAKVAAKEASEAAWILVDEFYPLHTHNLKAIPSETPEDE